ncbi:MAG TPA: hypothetical protein VN641_00445, partial [Urbifossiella sp.]|nr:hypothetical protein [Urbifossiella sp.]
MRSLQRGLIYTILGLFAFALLPLGGAVKADPRGRNGFIPFQQNGQIRPNLLLTMSQMGNMGAMGMMGGGMMGGGMMGGGMMG